MHIHTKTRLILTNDKRVLVHSGLSSWPLLSVQHGALTTGADTVADRADLQGRDNVI